MTGSPAFFVLHDLDCLEREYNSDIFGVSFNVGLLYFLIIRIGCVCLGKEYHRDEAFSPYHMVEGYDIIDDLAFITWLR